MNMDTLIAIKYPIFYRNYLNKKSSIVEITLSSIVLFNLILTLPLFVKFKIFPALPDVLTSKGVQIPFKTINNVNRVTFYKIYDPLVVVLTFVIPYTFILIFNGLTWYIMFQGYKRCKKIKIRSMRTQINQVNPISNDNLRGTNWLKNYLAHPFSQASGINCRIESGFNNTSRILTIMEYRSNSIAPDINTLKYLKKLKSYRLTNFIITSGILSTLTFIFSIPWVIFVFAKNSYWKTGFDCKSDFEMIAYCFMITKYYVFPFLIILGNRANRKKIYTLSSLYIKNLKRLFNRLALKIFQKRNIN
ncbi:unnamed protein product [Gordionus sp. m RMFG-2023]